MKMLAKASREVMKKAGLGIVSNPVIHFHSNDYLRHTARRLEHLTSLRIPVTGMSVLELGAGIGDHSHYYMDRGCAITVTEARKENLHYLRKRYPASDIQFLDMERPTGINGSSFDVVHCYGLLYHLNDPERAVKYLGQSTKKILFLETCVSFGDGDLINLTREAIPDPTQANSGMGCRPTRPWLYKKLREVFEYVYLPKTQPWHEEFPLDWSAPEKHAAELQRAVFVASHERLEYDTLVPSLIMKQTRHE